MVGKLVGGKMMGWWVNVSDQKEVMDFDVGAVIGGKVSGGSSPFREGRSE